MHFADSFDTLSSRLVTSLCGVQWWSWPVGVSVQVFRQDGIEGMLGRAEWMGVCCIAPPGLLQPAPPQ